MSGTRAEMLQTFLECHALDGWIAFRADELVMMTGHLPLWGISVLLYPAKDRPVLFIPELEPRQHLPQGVTIREYPWGRLDSTHPFEILFEKIRFELKNLGLESSRLGFMHGSSRSAPPLLSGETPPLPEFFIDQLTLLASNNNAQVQQEFCELYLHKTAVEIESIRLANQVAARGIAAFYHSLQTGFKEVEVASAVEAAIQNQTGETGVSFARSWAMVQSGPNTAMGGTFNRSSGRRLMPGDLVLLELATCVNGFWSDLTRTGAVGKAPSHLLEVFDTVREAQGAAVRAVRPGVMAAEVDQTARELISRRGFGAYFQHGTGHHVGFRYHDPGFGIGPSVEVSLAPGMIITIEPGIYDASLNGGVRIEDNVLVTEAGQEILSTAPRGLNGEEIE
jgi:Xaa-Pro dipeptidase